MKKARRGLLSELAAHYEKEGAPKGEVVIVVAPPGEKEIGADEIDARLSELLKTHSVKEAASLLAKETGRPRRDLYALALRKSHGEG